MGSFKSGLADILTALSFFAFSVVAKLSDVCFFDLKNIAAMEPQSGGTDPLLNLCQLCVLSETYSARLIIYMGHSER